MKLYYDKRLSDPTYYVQKGFRNGSKTTTKNIMIIGKHSELLLITDDPLAYAKEKIREINENERTGKVEYTLTADFNEKVQHTQDSASSPTQANIGYFMIQNVMAGLNLKNYFKERTKDMKVTFDCYTISRFLTYARILNPSSKLDTWKNLGNYYEKPDFDYQHILRFMDILEGDYSGYLTWLYKNSCKVVKRDTSVLYYDCTNFYFETESPDEDFVDEVTGEIIPGLRQYGVSKEHRPNPIVEMGLFMDRRGIPITMCLHPGNRNEQTTAIPLEKEVVKMLGGAKFIYCADAGLGSYGIRKFNSLGGRSFIVTQSIKKLGDTLKQAVFNDCDYRLLSSDKAVSLRAMMEFNRENPDNLWLYNDFAYKKIEASSPVDLGFCETKQYKNGKTKEVKVKGTVKQYLIVTFSRKMMEYQRAVRNRQIDRAKKILENSDPEEIKKGPNDVKRFLKKAAKTKSGEEATVEYFLDEEKIREEEKYDGFYAVATNLDDPAKDILAISGSRYKIEDCFRIMKTNFTGRPVNHYLPRRIRAHFMICYTALLAYRLMEAKLEDQGTHVTTADMITTMKNMNVANVHDVEYMALYKGSRALDALNQMTGLNLDMAHYRPKELNMKIKKFLK